jgi:hypothetical protein
MTGPRSAINLGMNSMGGIARYLLMSRIANWIADFGFWLHKRQISAIDAFKEAGCAEATSMPDRTGIIYVTEREE